MKKVIITIDTEGHDGMDPVSKLIWGKTKQGLFGIDRIMDICDTYNAKVLFFVDIAEAWDYGKDKIAEVITHILERGHDVGVHIHPDHMADKNRLFLWEYSKEEQFDIIKKCTDLYIEVTGKQPLAFRAGKYGANRDTLDIIDELGYKYDFSQFYGQKWCGIKPPVAYVMPQKYNNITEFPVTVFKSFKFGKYERFDKVDAVMDQSEYRYVINSISKGKNDCVISLFYHSFSMLKWRKDPDKPVPDYNEEKKFIKAIEYIYNSEKVMFTNLAGLTEVTDSVNGDTISNIIETKGFVRKYYYTFKRIYNISKFNNKAKQIIEIFIGILFCIFALMIFFII